MLHEKQIILNIFSMLAEKLFWHGRCCYSSMKLALNNTVLSHISHGIKTNPRMALLLANEYMEPSDPLRLALVAKSKRIGFNVKDEADRKIEEGATKESISLENKELGSLSPVRKFRFKPISGVIDQRRRVRQSSFRYSRTKGFSTN